MNKQEEIQDWNVRVSKRLQEAINEAWDEAVYGYAALLRFLQSYDPRTI